MTALDHDPDTPFQMPPTVEPGWLARHLHATPAANRQEVLMQHLSVMIQDLLGLDTTERFTPQQRLFELGLPSRHVIDLKNRLEAAFAVVLPVTLFFQQATLEMLTAHLLTKILGLAPVTEAPSTTPPRPPSPSRIATEIEHLEQCSETEAEARILAKIADVHKRFGL